MSTVSAILDIPVSADVEVEQGPWSNVAAYRQKLLPTLAQDALQPEPTLVAPMIPPEGKDLRLENATAIEKPVPAAQLVEVVFGVELASDAINMGKEWIAQSHPTMEIEAGFLGVETPLHDFKFKVDSINLSRKRGFTPLQRSFVWSVPGKPVCVNAHMETTRLHERLMHECRKTSELNHMVRNKQRLRSMMTHVHTFGKQQIAVDLGHLAAAHPGHRVRLPAFHLSSLIYVWSKMHSFSMEFLDTWLQNRLDHGPNFTVAVTPVQDYQLPATRQTVELTLSARGLPRMDFIPWSSIDPFVVISRVPASVVERYHGEVTAERMAEGDGERTDTESVCATTVIKRNKAPQWPPVQCNLFSLCSGDPTTPLLFEVYDYNRLSSNDFVGAAVTTMAELLDGQVELPLARHQNSQLRAKSSLGSVLVSARYVETAQE